MAVKDSNYVKTFRGVKSGDFVVDVGDSLLIEGIYVSGATNEDYLQILIDKTTVGYFLIGGDKGNHLAFKDDGHLENINILEFLRSKGIFNGYPVGEGQKVSFTTVNGSTITVLLKMILAGTGDYTPDKENGSEAKDYLYLNYGKPSTDPTSAGDILLDKSLIPVEFPQFPFGDSVPAKAEIDVLGVCSTPVGKSTGSNANVANTTFLKFIKEREVLFDKDRNGIPLIGKQLTSDGIDYVNGYTPIGFNSTLDKKTAYMFDSELVFGAGEELNVFVTSEVNSGSQNITSDDLLTAMIMRYKKTG